MNETVRPDAKVLFRVRESDGSSVVETLWALDLGRDQYKLKNSPFYAYSVSWEDVVYAPFDPNEGFPTYQRVVSKSGNRTVRAIFDLPIEPGNASDQLAQELLALGCSYEGANRRYIALNVPSAVDLQAVGTLLTKRKVTWEYADPSYGELFPDAG